MSYTKLLCFGDVYPSIITVFNSKIRCCNYFIPANTFLNAVAA